MEFLPKPKEVKLLTGEHALCYDGRIVLEGRLLGNGDAYAKVLQQGIQKETGMQYEMGYGVPGRKETGAIVIDTVFNRAEKTFIFQKISHTNTIECNCSLRCSRTSQSVEFLSRSCILT